MQKWEDYGYIDFFAYSDYLSELFEDKKIDETEYNEALKFGDTPSEDGENAKKYVQLFEEYYKSQGFTVTRLNAQKQGNAHNVRSLLRTAAGRYCGIPPLQRSLQGTACQARYRNRGADGHRQYHHRRYLR